MNGIGLENESHGPVKTIILMHKEKKSVEDIEEMEQLGIIECDEEDFALCAFACPSKIDLGSTIRTGLDLMEKES